jgi:hypothetical protein
LSGETVVVGEGEGDCGDGYVYGCGGNGNGLDGGGVGGLQQHLHGDLKGDTVIEPEAAMLGPVKGIKIKSFAGGEQLREEKENENERKGKKTRSGSERGSIV